MADPGCMAGFELAAQISEYTLADDGESDHSAFTMPVVGGTQNLPGSALRDIPAMQEPDGRNLSSTAALTVRTRC